MVSGYDRFTPGRDASVVGHKLGGGSTAAVVAPIGVLKGEEFELTNPPVDEHSVAMRLRQELTGIQNGTVADRHGRLTAVR
nr:hypothetical protein [Pseudoclavibacter sp. Marseille-Q3772]